MTNERWSAARRLSIIDLETGRQPLTDESDKIICSQNGEIYNYVELRADLERRGHVFRTHGDTETIVHLYEEFGPTFAVYLRGMFAIAIWDGRMGRLVLARDRLGKKPIYWRLSDGRLTYGSELKTILVEGGFERKVDRAALDQYLQYQYVPAPSSMLQGVHKLAPASVLVWEGGAPSIERYWNPRYTPKTRQNFRDDVEEGASLIREAVRLRLRSDVPVGVFLSGGMDSSVVTALMAELSASPVRTFSIGFENQAFDELPYARAVAQRFGTQHTEEIVRLDAIELLPELADHYDEPFADPSAIPTFRVSQVASQHLKVVLTGDGGDESFGGYGRYVAQRKFNTLDRVPVPLLRGIIRSGRAVLELGGSPARLRRMLDLADELTGMGENERYVALMTLVRDPDRSKLMGGSPSISNRYLLDILESGPRNGTDRILRADLLTYLPEDLLVKMDRATMANALEARAPLLDHKVVEFAATLPTNRKIKGSTTKVLLRAIAKQLMPDSMVDRPKMGFGVPIEDWFRGELGDRYRELVLAPDSAVRDHMDQSVAARLLVEHIEGRESQHHRLWALLMFELWARRWLRT